jgi:hypothetical protein
VICKIYSVGMSFMLVLDQRGGPTGRGQRFGSAAGALLVVVAALAAIPAVGLTALRLAMLIPEPLVSDTIGEYVSADIVTNVDTLLASAVLVTVATLTVGLLLTRRERRIVLFLRRFGHAPATHAVTQAVARIGVAWRLVTLDDDQVQPVGASGRARDLIRAKERASSVGSWLGELGALLGAIGTFSLLALFGLGINAGLEGVDPASLVETGEVPWFNWALVGAGVAIALLALRILYGALRVVLTPLFLAVARVEKEIRDAETAKALHVGHSAAIAAAAKRVRRQARRVFGARLTVLKVHSSIWKQTVTTFAAISSTPLIDISEPTENVLWEVETLTAQFGPRCLFIGQQDLVARLQDLSDKRPLAVRLRQHLRGREVLAYTTDRAGAARFARALAATLAQHATMPLPTTARTGGQHP